MIPAETQDPSEGSSRRRGFFTDVLLAGPGPKSTQWQSSSNCLAWLAVATRMRKARSNVEVLCEGMHGERRVTAGATVTVELCSPRRTS